MKRIVKPTLCLALCLLLAAGTAGCALFSDKAPEFSMDTQQIALGSPYKRYFERLSQKEKAAYNAVLSAVSAFPERIEVPSMTRDELNETYTALLYDNPELFFLSGETVVRQIKKRAYLCPSYRMDAADYDAMYRKCEEIAVQIAEEARGEKTAFDRERVVHDRLIAMCRYTDDAANIYKGTIYGVLCGGEAACEGYAKTAKFLLDRLGIPCYVIHGSSAPPGSRTQSHMWNVVQLDGDWYHLDLTWDDPVLEKGGDLIRYDYFNVTDQAVRKTHAGYDAGVLCDATQDNFLVHEHLLFSQFGEEEIRRAAAFAARVLVLGSEGFQLHFADREAYEDAQAKLFKKEAVYTLLAAIEAQTQLTFATDRVTYYTTDEDCTIEIIPVR